MSEPTEGGDEGERTSVADQLNAVQDDTKHPGRVISSTPVDWWKRPTEGEPWSVTLDTGEVIEHHPQRWCKNRKPVEDDANVGRMAGNPIALSGMLACAARECPVVVLKVTGDDGRPQPPAGWYEVVVGRTVLFAHSRRCAQAVGAGFNRGRPMSDVPIGE